MRKPLILVASAAVLGTFGAGAAAYAAFDKTVTLTVDGASRSVSTFSGDVRGVLAAAHTRLGPHDTVAPDLGAPVHDGSRIVVAHGRPLTLSVDGRERTVWVTARNVNTALSELGLNDREAWLSASRSRPLPVAGFALAVRTPQQVTVLVGSQRLKAITTAPSVSALLAELGVPIGATDQVSVPMTTYPTTGMTVRVVRVRTRTTHRTVRIPNATVYRHDSSLAKGTSRMLVGGHDGREVVTYRDVYRDGKRVAHRKLGERVTLRPRTRVVALGTHVVSSVSSTSSSSSSGGSSSHHASSGGLNWGALAQCESGGNPHSVSSGGDYRGLYQFTYGTWASVGGSGDPAQASSGEQTYRAELLYQREGTSPWPVCGHYLYS